MSCRVVLGFVLFVSVDLRRLEGKSLRGRTLQRLRIRTRWKTYTQVFPWGEKRMMRGTKGNRIYTERVLIRNTIYLGTLSARISII